MATSQKSRVMSKHRSKRHSSTCHYCGQRVHGLKTWDHIVPKALGGPGWTWNLVTSCKPCNSAKANGVHLRDHCDRCVFAWRMFETVEQVAWPHYDVTDMALLGIKPRRGHGRG